MYIKSIYLDGFKSYGRKTEIKEFDPEFNAITGLNGTGKSNILDAICFLLGITNLTNVRAGNLQDLVYKNGTAGVTKASVSIVFDNTDRDKCPVGYESSPEITVTRQIVVGGKNKYIINGRNAQNKAVHDLFCSVQMNVNNPNFLIMQGRITKVLNMTPSQILSMIEESAGTAVYEEKRAKSLTMIEKKESKISEYNAMIKEDIEPKLEKLRQDVSRYNEYQKICRDIELFTRVYISFKYLEFQKAIQSSDQHISKLTNQIEKYQQTIAANEVETKEIDGYVKEIQQKVDTELGGELVELEKRMDEMTKQDASLKAEINTAKENIKSDERKIKTLKNNIQVDEKALTKKREEMDQMSGTFENFKMSEETDKQAFLEAQKRYEAVSSGLYVNEDGEATTLQDQLATAKSKASEAATKIKECEMELKHTNSTLATKQKEIKTNDTAYENDKSFIQELKGKIRQVEQTMASCEMQTSYCEKLQQRQQELIEENRVLNQKIDRLGGHRWEFKYRQPVPDFDNSKVKGMVGNLITVKDPRYSMALSMLAGNGLRNVIVSDEKIGKLLIARGDLAQRVTFIPLNKIKGRKINDSIVTYAQNMVGRENAIPAISLIDFDPELEPAMRSIFGSTFVCPNLEIARKVTFHPSIKTRSITLDGDTVDPQGILSGGSAPTSDPLKDLAEINTARRQFETNQKQLKAMERDLNKIDIYMANKQKYDMLVVELEMAEKRILTTTFQQSQDEIDALKAKVETLKQTIQECREIQKQNQEKAKDIDAKIRDAKGYRDRELKQAENAMKAAKKKSEESRNNWKKREQDYETLKLEIEDLQKTVNQSKEQLEIMEQALMKARETLETLSAANEKSKGEFDETKRKIKEQKDKIASQNSEIKTKIHRKDKLLKANENMLLDIKKCENEIAKTQTDNKDGYNKISSLEEKFPWISNEKDKFGVQDTMYDYKKHDPHDAGKKLNKLQEQKDKLSRNINERAMMLLESMEEHFSLLMKRRAQVDSDKQKLMYIIEELDKQKEEALEKAWRTVNKNFSSIFSTMLPGADAKLEMKNPNDLKKGLMIVVGFNGQWKEDLRELSGGQRSLIALSLTLAMLKFNPAPIYILDEIDAALDLSHTQNIGIMLKTHFTGSQFIVVSLKEGMFSYANVLFQTKFIDGMSGVVRTARKK